MNKNAKKRGSKLPRKCFRNSFEWKSFLTPVNPSLAIKIHSKYIRSGRCAGSCTTRHIWSAENQLLQLSSQGFLNHHRIKLPTNVRTVVQQKHPGLAKNTAPDGSPGSPINVVRLEPVDSSLYYDLHSYHVTSWAGAIFSASPGWKVLQCRGDVWTCGGL